MKFPSFGRPLGMFGTHMGLELFGALPFIGSLHFVKRVADEQS